MSVFIRAEGVYDCGNGIFRIDLPMIPVSDKEREMIHSLFPNLSEKVYETLEQEALLQAITNPDASKVIDTKPVPVSKNKKKPANGYEEPNDY